MPLLVTLNGAVVDADDPCALWQALYAVKLKRLAGEAIEETEIRSPVTQRRIKVASTNMKDLDAELERLAVACSAKAGGRRTRFAKQFRFTP
ncbi:hypothetical protein [Pararhizobium sp. O133]|uniref:hypothetical protein n=1 Tax=Pararhizobium sp. O133 TaxID=3449278 RepID=UPI003F688E6D